MALQNVCPPSTARVSTQVAIVGSGFGGLAAAHELKQAGVHDFLILERAGDVGGVWRDNSYPGCACDVQSHLYSFSFAPNPDWSRAFSPQAEILSYLQRCARELGLMPHVRLNHEVLQAKWDEASATQLAVSIKVTIVDKPGMIRTVSHVLETRGINIDGMHARARRGHGEVVFAVTINTLDELDGLLSELRRVKGVMLAERLSAKRSV